MNPLQESSNEYMKNQQNMQINNLFIQVPPQQMSIIQPTNNQPLQYGVNMTYPYSNQQLQIQPNITLGTQNQMQFQNIQTPLNLINTTQNQSMVGGFYPQFDPQVQQRTNIIPNNNNPIIPNQQQFFSLLQQPQLNKYQMVNDGLLQNSVNIQEIQFPIQQVQQAQFKSPQILQNQQKYQQITQGQQNQSSQQTKNLIQQENQNKIGLDVLQKQLKDQNANISKNKKIQQKIEEDEEEQKNKNSTNISIQNLGQYKIQNHQQNLQIQDKNNLEIQEPNKQKYELNDEQRIICTNQQLENQNIVMKLNRNSNSDNQTQQHVKCLQNQKHLKNSLHIDIPIQTKQKKIQYTDSPTEAIKTLMQSRKYNSKIREKLKIQFDDVTQKVFFEKNDKGVKSIQTFQTEKLFNNQNLKQEKEKKTNQKQQQQKDMFLSCNKNDQKTLNQDQIDKKIKQQDVDSQQAEEQNQQDSSITNNINNINKLTDKDNIMNKNSNNSQHNMHDSIQSLSSIKDIHNHNNLNCNINTNKVKKRKILDLIGQLKNIKPDIGKINKDAQLLTDNLQYQTYKKVKKNLSPLKKQSENENKKIQQQKQQINKLKKQQEFDSYKKRGRKKKQRIQDSYQQVDDCNIQNGQNQNYLIELNNRNKKKNNGDFSIKNDNFNEKQLESELNQQQSQDHIKLYNINNPIINVQLNQLNQQDFKNQLYLQNTMQQIQQQQYSNYIKTQQIQQQGLQYANSNKNNTNSCNILKLIKKEEEDNQDKDIQHIQNQIKNQKDNYVQNDDETVEFSDSQNKQQHQQLSNQQQEQDLNQFNSRKKKSQKKPQKIYDKIDTYIWKEYPLHNTQHVPTNFMNILIPYLLKIWRQSYYLCKQQKKQKIYNSYEKTKDVSAKNFNDSEKQQKNQNLQAQMQEKSYKDIKNVNCIYKSEQNKNNIINQHNKKNSYEYSIKQEFDDVNLNNDNKNNNLDNKCNCLYCQELELLVSYKKNTKTVNISWYKKMWKFKRIQMASLEFIHYNCLNTILSKGEYRSVQAKINLLLSLKTLQQACKNPQNFNKFK